MTRLALISRTLILLALITGASHRALADTPQVAPAAPSMAAVPATSASTSQETPGAIFDRAAAALPTNAVAAKSLFSQAALGFEQHAAQTANQHDRGQSLYNAGAARQLAGDRARAVLNFRRAQLLAPLTPGLDERLSAARAEARAETTPTTPTTPHAGELQIGAWLHAVAASIPRSIRWTTLIACCTLFWLILLLRITLRPLSPARPHGSLLAAAGVLAALALGGFGFLAWEDAAVADQAVILADTTPRAEPDDLVGKASPGSALLPGREVVVLDHRTGGDGQPWFRVRALDDHSDAPISQWIPAAAAARILDDATPVLAAR